MIEIFDRKSLSEFMARKKFSVKFCQHIASRFGELERTLCDVEDIAAGSQDLKEYGYIVVLQREDNFRDLSEVGLNPEDCGLLGAIPETIEKFGNGTSAFYEICVIYNNSYMMIFMLPETEIRPNSKKLKEFLQAADIR
jgi:hypothetical protein